MKRIDNYQAIAYILLVFMVVVMTACEKEIISERDYPRMAILEELQQDESGVTFSGAFITEGTETVIDKGFVWVYQKEYFFNPGNTPSIEDSRVSAGPGYVSESFSASTDADFIRGNTYYVRAYARTENHIVYSNGISFESTYNKPPAEILEFVPAQAMWRDTITLRGKHLSFIEENLSVKFGTMDARVLSCTDSSISVIVPKIWNQPEVSISLDVYDQSLLFDDPFQFLYPQVFDFSPKVGTHQDVITITGSDFPENASDIVVSLNDRYVSVLEHSNSHIVVSIPATVMAPEAYVTTEILGLSTTFPEPFVFIPE